MVLMPILGWVMGLLLILAFFPIALASGVLALILRKMATVNTDITNTVTKLEPMNRPKSVR